MKKKTTYSDFKKMIQSSDAILVEFYALWCAPCREMHRILNQLNDFDKKIDILRLDIDAPENYKLTQEFNISTVPTLIIFRDGEMLWRTSGVVSAEYLEKTISRLPVATPSLH